MMTLEEAIQHCDEKQCGGGECDMEHQQLGNWLRELKDRREHERFSYPNMHVYLYHDGNEGAPIMDIWTHSVPDVGEKVIVWNEEQFVHYIVKRRIFGCNQEEKLGVWNLYLEKII